MADHEHIVQIPADALPALREWLAHPNGAHSPTPRVSFEAVENGSIWIRTKPFTSERPS